MAKMDYGQIMARAFAMDDRAWARHANPLSFWTRLPILPLLAAAIWSRVWLGWWALLPVAALLAWAFVNPRAFPPPPHTRAWASRAVLGERVWLARRSRPIPFEHALMAHLLSAVAALGALPLAYGLFTLKVWPTMLGLTLAVGAKLWFCDRMAWLHDVKGSPETPPSERPALGA